MRSQRRSQTLASARRSAGFTLLEAIVALVIFSTAGLALFSWINQNLQALNRVTEVSAEARAKRNVLEFMNEVNPMEHGAGSRDFGAYKVEWRSTEELPPRPNSDYPSGTGAFLVALYRTAIDVTRPNGDPWFAFDLKLVGYRRLFAPTPSRNG